MATSSPREDDTSDTADKEVFISDSDDDEEEEADDEDDEQQGRIGRNSAENVRNWYKDMIKNNS